MKQETLKVLRITVSGVIIFLFFLPLLQNYFNLEALVGSFNYLKGHLYLIVIFSLGGLYYIINLRKFFIKDSLSKFHNNIKTKLLSPFSDDDRIASATNKLMKGRKLIIIFYKLIDNDESLKKKARNIYFNGLIWTTVADIMAVSFVAIGFYIIRFFFLQRDHFLFFALGLGFLHLFASRILMPIVTKMHIELIDKQLDHIEVNSKEYLHKELKKLL